MLRFSRYFRFSGALGIAVAMLAVACGSSNGANSGDGGEPICPDIDVCTQTLHGDACMRICAPDGASTCPLGQVCTSASACCSGTECSAVSVHVCCPPSGC